MSDLKPCPFCGEQPKLKDSFSVSGNPKRAKQLMWLVSCTNLCDVRPRTPPLPTKDHAIEAWNRRSDP